MKICFDREVSNIGFLEMLGNPDLHIDTSYRLSRLANKFFNSLGTLDLL
jgi:hypothetical protein